MFDPKRFIYLVDGHRPEAGFGSYYCEYTRSPRRSYGSMCRDTAMWGWDIIKDDSFKDDSFTEGYYFCDKHYRLLTEYLDDDAKLIEYAKSMRGSA